MPHEPIPAPPTMKCLGCAARYRADEAPMDGRCIDPDCGATLVKVIAVIAKDS